MPVPTMVRSTLIKQCDKSEIERFGEFRVRLIEISGESAQNARFR